MSRCRLTPEAARIVDAIEEKCQALARMPETGPRREVLATGLRSSLVGPYVLFDRVTDEGIDVIRVIHGRRDIPRLFE